MLIIATKDSKDCKQKEGWSRNRKDSFYRYLQSLGKGKLIGESALSDNCMRCATEVVANAFFYDFAMNKANLSIMAPYIAEKCSQCSYTASQKQAFIQYLSSQSPGNALPSECLRCAADVIPFGFKFADAINPVNMADVGAFIARVCGMCAWTDSQKTIFYQYLLEKLPGFNQSSLQCDVSAVSQKYTFVEATDPANLNDIKALILIASCPWTNSQKTSFYQYLLEKLPGSSQSSLQCGVSAVSQKYTFVEAADPANLNDIGALIVNSCSGWSQLHMDQFKAYLLKLNPNFDKNCINCVLSKLPVKYSFVDATNPKNLSDVGAYIASICPSCV